MTDLTLAPDPTTPRRRKRPQTRREEAVNATLHGIGLLAGVAVAVSAFAIAGAGDLQVRVAAGWYGVAVVAVFLCSFVSHALDHSPNKRRWEAFDQAAIFLMIAGSYLPYAAVWLRGGWWPALTLAVMATSLVGFVLKGVFRLDGARRELWLYLILGWVPAMSMIHLVTVMPEDCIRLTVIGGLCYTFGFAFLTLDHHRHYLHAVWHAFVLGGAGCHAAAILGYVLPTPAVG
jgi:hemolysin III